jgi:signal transduction histidine kinase
VYADLIIGDSELAQLIRNLDWALTPLGPIEMWSQVLLTQVNLVICSPDPATLCWGEDFIFFYNDAVIPNLGTKHPNALGKPQEASFAEVWHLLKPELEASFLRGETPKRENFLLPLLRGGQLEDAYFTYTLLPIYDRGKIVAVRGVHENTTDKVLARLERDALAAQLSQVLDVMTDAVVTLSPEWLITYMNASAKEMFRAAGPILGTNCWETYPHQIYPGSPFVEVYERAMYQRVAGSFEVFYPDPLNLDLKIEAIPSPDGIAVFTQDVTGQRRLEKELREVEARERERLNELFELTPAFLAVLGGPEHVYEMANHAYRVLFTDRQFIGKRVVDVVPEVKDTAWMSILDGVYRTGVAHTARGASLAVARSRDQKGLEERIIDYVFQPRRGREGTVTGIVVMGIDVTDQRKAEEALIKSEKLAVVGRLASTIAHEINNPLAAAMNYLYLAGHSERISELREHVASAEGELRRVCVISTQTLLSQKQSVTPSSTSFKSLCEDVLHLYQGRLKVAHVKIEALHRDEAPLVCMEGEMRQVLGNLVSNALDAMSPDGGRLLLRSWSGTDWTTGRKGKKLTLADTGPGIAPTILESIFEPFFTTKGSVGNGLGLWITKEIIDRHHGEIRVRSVLGCGTVFSLFLPGLG